ncbi:unnamed protein product [Hyaloperonospora brassicae]|uniref:Protein arginine N-methyltransferase domain-containing protein n=1 Tax=Hyaloperonospora brassicae TaxID=162125 RepID=A0AAV0UQI6_HYABA|nr:unnamed protein product [Hyaloperonospora brassicae]
MYAGIDKYGGTLVGESHANTSTSSATATASCASDAPPASGVSLEEAIETAAAEETVVVDVPYSYLVDETDPHSLVSGVSTVLLSAQLNPEAGGLMWIEQSHSSDVYANVVAMSQMTSMLRDTDRNTCYERGIQQAIARFQAQHHRAPIVLDIGTGTGLLAMLAARHGAAHVYACEMFVPMAAIAEQVTAANYPDTITVFKLRSTDLRVQPAEAQDREPSTTYHLPRRADMLVSELFDSALLGEAVLPTIRHAMQHLLTSTAVIVPERATVFAQVIESESIYHFNSFDVPLQSSDTCAGELRQAVLARSDSAWQCKGGKPALPVHFQALENDATFLTKPVEVLTFDFTKQTTGTHDFRETIVDVCEAGKVQAVLMWWEVSFSRDDSSVVYSTKAGAMNWQDHWVQVVFPLVENIQTRPSENLILRAHHDDVHIWFDVEAVPAKKDSLGETQRAIMDEKPPCTCGMHLICNAERVAMLTDSARCEAYTAAVSSSIAELTQQEALRPISCLDISDGSLVALLAAMHKQVSSVTSIESKEVSARIFDQIVTHNAAEVKVLNSGVKGLLPEHLQGAPPSVDLLVGEPFYYSMQNLPLWQAFNFWLRRSAVDGLLHPKSRVLPARARVLAQAVRFEHLHECFGAVGNVSGFDHSYFDRFQDGYHGRDFPFPVYMYPHEPASDVVELAAMDFMLTAHTVATNGTISLKDSAANAVIVWVEYVLDMAGHHVVATGPAVRYAKQLVRFLRSASSGAASAAAVHSVAYRFCFDSLEGTIELSLDVN